MVRYLVEQFEQKEQLARGYDLVYTPHIASEKIYQTSGHLETYRENMYAPMSIEEVDYYLKPMNCPGHIMIYKNRVHSYRDLPIRLAELGTVYRYERSGTLHGMLRVRGFTQDDAHIFCTPEQVVDEVGGVLDLADAHGRRLRLRVPGLPGDAARRSRSATRRGLGDGDGRPASRALEIRGLPYKIDEGGGAFYGPKIDIKWVDALGREWTGPTIQVDFNLPERFDVNYIGEDGERHRVGDDPPHAARLDGALRRRADRALRRRLPGLAGAGAGGHHPHHRRPVRLRARRGAPAGGAGLARRGQRPRATACRPRSATPSCRRFPYMLVVGKREAEAGRGRRPPAQRPRPGRDAGRRVPRPGAAAHRVPLASTSTRLRRRRPKKPYWQQLPERRSRGYAAEGFNASSARIVATILARRSAVSIPQRPRSQTPGRGPAVCPRGR